MTAPGSLIDHARAARDNAIAPYSGYEVGAAIVTTDEEVFTGCNLEVVNYSNSLHAEEVAIAKALSEGHTDFELLALSTSSENGATPCGMCRQTLAEFCEPEFEIVTATADGFDRFALGELLPEAFEADL